MIARDLVRLLKVKHSGDVFVEECKDGPTHTTEHRRIDAWAMAKSWAHPRVSGYEVKISRGDFLQDTKWPDYLPMCNELYFVCPTGLIQPPELPTGVGLLWASKTGTKLYTKKKATYRDVTIPEEVFRYILMSRTHITGEDPAWGSKREYWERWLEDQKFDWDFGRHVGKTLAARVRTEIEVVRSENERLRRQMETYDAIQGMLKALGLEADNVSTWRARDTIEAARAALPQELLSDLAKVAKSASDAYDALHKLASA